MRRDPNPNFLLKIVLILCGVMLLCMGLLWLLTRSWAEEEKQAEEAATATSTTVTTETVTEAGTGAATETVTETKTEVKTEAKTEAVTEARTEAKTETVTEAKTETVSEAKSEITYWFRTKAQRDQHYEKHGKEMGFDSAEAYLMAANEVVKDPSSLHKIEKEDGDDVYYREADNAFVIVSTDGYIRTFFYPSGGKAYYDRQ